MKLALPGSLRHKLFGVVLLTTLVALVIALGAMTAYALRAYHRGLIADMTTQAELLVRATAPALAFDDPRVAVENLGLLRFRPGVAAAAIYTARGALFARYVRAGEEHRFPKLPDPEGLHIEARDLILYKRVVSNGEILGTVYLRADYELLDRVLDYLGIAGAALVAAMAVAFLMSAWLQRVVTRPILAIAGVAREVVEHQDYSRRAEKMSADEVGTLVDSFNDMLGEIERRTLAMENSNRELAREVEERNRAEQEVLRLNVELEDRVRQRTAQLESANKELEAFSYSVSHDLRAPLRAIDGFAHMLEEDYRGKLDAEGMRLLGVVRASSRRMSQLIDDLLAFSRLGRATINSVTIDMNRLAKEAWDDVQAERQDSFPVFDLKPLPTAPGDRSLLKQVWTNLLSNALKYSSTRSESRIEVSGEENGREYVYCVRDNGVGFDMRFYGKLFGVFQRLHSQQEFTGTGVGLAIVQRVVTRHGGRVWAEGEVGRGAGFYFSLPREGAK